MRTIVRIAGIVALLLGQQVLAPMTGSAQIDPCNPIPIPGLCEQPVPSPSPSPLPSPGDVIPGGGGDGGGGGGGGGIIGGGGGGGGGGGQVSQGGPAEPQPPAQPPTPTGPFAVSSPNNTQALVDLLGQLGRFGIPMQDALLRVVGPFPVAGLAYWNDDWHACRDGCTRFHEGLDIFAQSGTPLVSVADGFVSQKLVGELSGTSIEITDEQGVQYFYAHLSAWAEPIQVGDSVDVGQVIAYVGNTGNAITTPPHLHLEVQPGGIPVPPKPFVDRWLEVAMAKAQALVARYTGKPVPEGSAFRLTRLFDLTGGSDGLEAGAQRLLALAGIQPSVTSLAMARRLLGQMAWEIDWAGQADAELAALAQQYSGLLGAQDLSLASPWSPLGVAQLPTELDLGGILQAFPGELPAAVGEVPGGLPGAVPGSVPGASPIPQPSVPPTTPPTVQPSLPASSGGGLGGLLDGERD
jgi:murein DD-endopeptidase MepM/ murein hydrolase activator NlpD